MNGGLANVLVSIVLFLTSCPLAAQKNEPVIISGSNRTSIVLATAANTDRVANLCLDQVNAYRRSLKLNALKVESHLQKTAQDFADFMADTGKYGHQADGKTPSIRVEAHGYEYALILENIAYAYRSAGFSSQELASQFVQGWKDSPHHHEAMIHPHATETAVAISRAGSGYYYAVQLFGRPQSSKYQFRIVNQSRSKFLYTVRTVDDPKSEQQIDLNLRQIRIHTVFLPTEIHFPWLGDTDWIQVTPDFNYTIMQDRQGEFAIQEKKAKQP